MTPKRKLEALAVIAGATLVALYLIAPHQTARVANMAGEAVGRGLMAPLTPKDVAPHPERRVTHASSPAQTGEMIMAPIAVASAVENANRLALDKAGLTLANRSEPCLSLVRRINVAGHGVSLSVKGLAEASRRRDAVVAEGVATGCFTKAEPAVPRDAYTTELYKAKRPAMATSTPACAELAAQADALYNDARTTPATKAQWLEKVFAVAASKGCGASASR